MAATLLRPHRAPAVLGGLIAALNFAFFVVQMNGGWWPTALAGLAVCTAACAFVARASTDPHMFRPDPRPISIRGGAIFAEEERLLDRAAITQGFVIGDSPGHALVELRAGGRRHFVSCAGAEQGEAILRELGLDPARTTAVYRVASQLLLVRELGLNVLLGLGLAATVAALLFSTTAGAFYVALFASIALLFGVLALWPTQILVGADAVVIRWLGSERRIRLDEIDHVVAAPGVLRLLLRTEEVIELAYPGKTPTGERLARLAAEGVSAGPAELGRAAERIDAVLAAYSKTTGDAPGLSLERGARPTAAWLRHLRAVGGSARAERAGYRSPALPPERLWRIVEDPASPPGARAGAAVALAGGLDDAGKKRMRIAAEATALPGMRVLLSTAAEEAADEAALCELLDRVDDGDEARRRRR